MPAAALGVLTAADTDYAPDTIVITGAAGVYQSVDGDTAMKTTTPLIEVPQTISVLTRDQLNDQNLRQLGEALRYVAGISLETGEGHRDEIFIRGQETTADFYLNGLRDDAQYYRPLYNIERVEVLKGANALIFGRGGGGGVINRVSKTADPMDSFITVDGSVDTFSGFALAGDINQAAGDDAGVRLNATYQEFDSHRDEYEGRFIGISPTATIEPGPNTRITLTYSYDDDERVVDRGNPAFNGGPLRGFDETFFGDPDLNRTMAEVHIARARLDHAFTPSLTFNVSGQYANYDKLYTNVLPRGTDGTTVELSGYRDAQDRENWIGQANLVWDVQTGTVNHTILAGAEFLTQDSRNGRENILFDTGGGAFESRVTVPLAEEIFVPATQFTPLIRERQSDLSVFSAYLQDQIDFGIVELVGGIRYERFDLDTNDLIANFEGARVDEKWSPRVGVIVKPTEQLSVYASYTESFLPQSGTQFFTLSPTTEALDPERFENVELGVKWAPREGMIVTAALFDLTRDNGATTDPDNPTLTILTGRTRTRGFEAQVAGNILPDLHANIGYTYLDGEIRSPVGGTPAGTTLAQVPEHHFAAWTRYDVTERFGLGAGLVHSSDQFASLSNAVTLPAYTRVDAAAYFEVNESVSLQVNIENLFDEDYYPSAHGDNNIQPARPLNASFGARVTF